MLKTHFAIFSVAVFLLMTLYPNVVQAQQEETAYQYEAQFSNLGPPTEGEVIKNNIADTENVKTEIDIWEKDLGTEVTEGSYVGPLYASSVFELDYKGLETNQPMSVNKTIYYIESEAINYIQDNIDTETIADLVPSAQLIYQIGVGLNITSQISEGTTSLKYTIPVAEKRSVCSLVQIVNFTNRVIMSGATEFWMKIPIIPSCINFEELTPTISIIPLNNDIDKDKLWLVGKPTITYSPIPSYTNWSAYGTDEQWTYPTDAGRILPIYTNGEYSNLRLQYNGQQSSISQSVNKKYMINNSLYTKIYGTIEPNTNYIVSFSFILNKNEKPKILLTEENLYHTSIYENETNPIRQSFFQISDIEFSNQNLYYYDSGIGESIFGSLYNRPILEVSTDWMGNLLPSSVNPINDTLEIPVDMSFSFIFKSGRGNYGMYGQSFNMKAGQSLVIYKNITPTTDKYISIMIPFVSEKTAKINAMVEFSNYQSAGINAIQNRFELQGELFYNYANFVNGSIISSPKFGYKSPYYWQSEEPQEYTDFILFTVPYKASAEFNILPRPIRITIFFEEDINITFMFSTILNSDLYKTEKFNAIDSRMNDQILGTSMTITPSYMYPILTYVPTSNFRSKLTYIYGSSKIEPIFYDGWENIEKYPSLFGGLTGVDYIRKINDVTNCEIVHAELFCSVQLTDGMWYQMATTGSGQLYATNFFERRMAIGLQDLYLDTTNKSSQVKVNWYDNGLDKFSMAWESFKKGDILNAVKYTVEGAISLLWDGLTTFMGWIKGVFENIWNGLVKLGKFVKTVLVEFWDTIISIVGDIVRNVEKILEVALYIIAIIIFAFVVSWSARFINLTSGGMDE